MSEEETGYDVFISYRRDGGAHYARMLDLAFRLIGVKPFFDREELKTGYFDESIYRHIERARYFLFVLSPGALKRCNEDSKDWVRRELVKALEVKGQGDGHEIIVVSPEEEFSWPSEMPMELKDMCRIQGHCINFSSDSFGDDVKKLTRECLKGVETDEDRRIKEAARIRALGDLREKALLYWTNDGKLDSKETSDLEDMRIAAGIDEKKAEEVIQDAKDRYELNKQKQDRKFVRRLKRFAVRAGIFAVEIAVIAGYAWYKGYQSGKAVTQVGTTSNSAVSVSTLLANGSTEVNESSTADEQMVKQTPSEMSCQVSVEGEQSLPKEGFVSRSIDDARKIMSGSSWNGIPVWTINTDFSRILSRRYRNTQCIYWSDQDRKRLESDPVTKEISRWIDLARKEPLAMVEAGMREDEIKRARPDLVMQLGDIRHAANVALKGLIDKGRHMEALSYYESVKTAFKYCGLEEFDRPDFAGGSD